MIITGESTYYVAPKEETDVKP